MVFSRSSRFLIRRFKEGKRTMKMREKMRQHQRRAIFSSCDTVIILTCCCQKKCA